MPWCESCSSYRAPSALDAEGRCKTCNEPVTATTEVRKKARIPWHFWLILIFAAVYLGWRAVQGVMWLVG